MRLAAKAVCCGAMSVTQERPELAVIRVTGSQRMLLEGVDVSALLLQASHGAGRLDRGKVEEGTACEGARCQTAPRDAWELGPLRDHRGLAS